MCNEIDGQGEYVTGVSKFDKGMFVWSERLNVPSVRGLKQKLRARVKS